MRILKWELTFSRKQAARTLSPPMTDGWASSFWNLVREPFAGAWQRNIDCRPESVLSFFAVYSCITLISGDIGKMRYKLEELQESGVWEEKSVAAYSPVLNKPNHFQTHNDFKESWVISLLRTGNTYVLKQRDRRGVVVALYVLDPCRVQPLIAPDGSIFYQLSSDNLADIESQVTIPASEIIHHRINCLFHPLVGVSPLYACGLPAALGLEIQRNSGKFFANGAKISGIITAPGALPPEKAAEVKAKFDTGYTGENAGKVAVLGDGLKFQQLTMSSTDAQLIEQLKLSAEQVCSAYHVPPFMVGVGQMPSYDNIEALNQQYYSQCLQTIIEKMESLLDEGLTLPAYYGVCLSIEDLLRMDSTRKAEYWKSLIDAAIAAPNEARLAFNMEPVEGGDSPMIQQQEYSLAAIAKRDALADPFGNAPAAPAQIAPPAADNPTPPDDQQNAAELSEAFDIVLKTMRPLALETA